MEKSSLTNIQQRDSRGIAYHNYLFVFGFIYYMVIPLIIVKNNLLTDYPAMHLLDEYNLNRFYNTYIICCVIIFVSFLSGSFWAKLTIKRKRTLSREPILGKHLINKFIIPIALVGLSVAFHNRGALFQGYLGEGDSAFTGSMATILLSSIFWMVYELVLYKKATKVLVYSVLIFAVILLGLGSRLYVLVPTIAYMIYLLEFKVVKPKKLIMGGGNSCLIFYCNGSYPLWQCHKYRWFDVYWIRRALLNLDQRRVNVPLYKVS